MIAMKSCRAMPRHIFEEVWIVDIENLTIEQYMQPRNGSYLVQHVYTRGDTLKAHVVAALELVVAQLFE